MPPVIFLVIYIDFLSILGNLHPQWTLNLKQNSQDHFLVIIIDHIGLALFNKIILIRKIFGRVNDETHVIDIDVAMIIVFAQILVSVH